MLGPGSMTVHTRTVEYDLTDGVATVRLNRPEAGNALDDALAEDLREVATRCAEDGNVRAVLLCAAGPTFTVGGDLELLGNLPGTELPPTLRRLIDSYHLAIRRFSELDAPVVAAVHGAAAGGGLGLVCCADVVIAAEDTKFALGYGALGLTADGGTSWFLPRLIGMRRAQQMFLEQPTLSAAEALEWGLVTRLAAPEAVQEQAASIARRLAEGPTRAIGAVRRLLRDSLSSTLGEHLDAEQHTMIQAGATADAAEGIAAFRGKRQPQFRGE